MSLSRVGRGVAHQFVDVSYFAQTPGGQRRKLMIIAIRQRKKASSAIISYEGVL
jgi:hypothetical protein